MWEKMGFKTRKKMFRGANKLTLDAKGRLVMPTRYRERLQERCGGHIVVTVDKDQLERCTDLFEHDVRRHAGVAGVVVELAHGDSRSGLRSRHSRPRGQGRILVPHRPPGGREE